MKIRPLSLIAFLLLQLSMVFGQDSTEATAPKVPVDIPTPIEIEVSEYDLAVSNGQLQLRSGDISGPAKISLNGEEMDVAFRNGRINLPFELTEKGALALLHTEATGHRLYHVSITDEGNPRIKNIPFWLSILPPLVAIALALVFKEVVISLFVGVWTGAFIAGGLRVDSIYYLFDSVLSVVERYVINALADSQKVSGLDG